jgi:hypothetical protein
MYHYAQLDIAIAYFVVVKLWLSSVGLAVEFVWVEGAGVMGLCFSFSFLGGGAPTSKGLQEQQRTIPAAWDT